MKILLLDSNLGKGGGIDRYNTNLLGALKELECTVKIAWLPNSSLLRKIIFVLSALFKYFILKPNVIFCGHIDLSPLTFFVKRFSNTDYIVFTHGIEVWNLKNKAKIKALKEAKLVVSVSKFTANKLKEQIPKVKDKQFILPNTIDGKRFKIKETPEYLLNRHNLKGKKVIFTLARLDKTEKYKGYDNVIKVLPDVLKNVPNAVYILGGKGDDIPRIKELIRKLGLENNVILTGFIPDKELVDYYNLCDVFVMPSKGEGFGIVFLEALACGKPVIAGNKDASGEAVLNGELGLLINPDSKKEISTAVIKILKNPNFFSEKNLRKMTLETYGFAEFVEKVKKLRNELQR